MEEDDKWTGRIIGIVGSLPLLAVITGHPIGYAVGIAWGVLGWFLMGEAFSDYKKMEKRVKELEHQRLKKE